MQQILYTRSDDVSLAYTVSGSADLPLIFIPGIVSNLALDEGNPPLARFYERVARFSRLVRWDRRGTGLSDQSADPLPLAEQARDLEAIRSAVGFERFAVIGYSHGTALAARYAAEHPERVSHLVLIAGPVCDARDPGDPSRPLGPWSRLIEATQDFATYVDRFVADAAPSAEAGRRARMANMIKASVSPRGMRQLLLQVQAIDLRALLADIRVPLFFLDSPVAAILLTAIEEFLTGAVAHTADRVMATVLFTDIVGSTTVLRSRGDEAWRDLRRTFEANSQRIVEQFGGRVVQFTGDGAMAAFPAASHALRAARVLVADARGLGVDIRAGVHAGEAYAVEDQLFGTCVTVAARVAAQAGAGELFTTETVQDLVAGAGFAFHDAGVFELKGLGSRRLLSVG